MKRILGLIVFTLLAQANFAAAQGVSPVPCNLIVDGDVTHSGARSDLLELLKNKGYNPTLLSQIPRDQWQVLDVGYRLTIQFHYKDLFGTAPDSLGVFLDVRTKIDDGLNMIAQYHDVPVRGADRGNDQKVLTLVAKIPSCVR